MALGDAPSRSLQNPSFTSTTAAAPRRSSSGLKFRLRMGRTPNSEKKLAETRLRPTVLRQPSSPRVPAHLLDMAAISKMLLCSLLRFFRRHSTADVLFRPQIDVKLPFFRELAMHFVAYTDGGD